MSLAAKLSFTLACGVMTYSGMAAADGPFGVTMGMDVAQLTSCKADTDPGYYICDALPRQHPDFEGYMVFSWPGVGVCSVSGAGKEIRTGSNGSTLISKTKNIIDQVTATYGTGLLIDEIIVGSIWKRPIDWMMSLLKDDRTYAYYIMSETTGHSLKNNIKNISIHAVADDIYKGHVDIVFSFINENKCKDARKISKGRAF